MKYNSIKGIDKPASALVFGCAGDVMLAGKDNSELLDAAFEQGITFYDTARTYDKSELSLGNWVKQKKNREDIIVLSKCCHPKEPNMLADRVNSSAIIEDLDESLLNLKMDYIDIYALHRDDLSVCVEEIIDTLEEKKRQGKILQYGASNWSMERFDEANQYAHRKGYDGFVINSPNYSLASQVEDPWQCGSKAISLGGPAGEKSRKYYLENNIPIVSYSSLARGLFSGKVTSEEIREMENATKIMDKCGIRGFYSEENIEKLHRVELLAKEKNASVSQIALAFLLNQRLTVFSIVGFSKKKHLKDNLGAVDIILYDDEVRYLEGDIR